MAKLPSKIAKYIETCDDERAIGNGLIITLKYGHSFEYGSHEGIRGFDTFRDANRARVYGCSCEECRANKR